MTMMLSTSDNPFDPFDEWDEWFIWDMVHGYNTPGLLDRVIVTSDSLSDADQEADREQAMRDIVEVNATGKHILVTRP